MSYIIQLAIYYYYFGDHGSVTTARQHFQLDNITIIGEVHDKSGGSGSSVNMEAAKLLSRFFLYFKHLQTVECVKDKDDISLFST